MQVKDLIKKLKTFNPNAVVICEGFDMHGEQSPSPGELNVVEERKNKVYVTYYEIGVSYNGKTWMPL